MDISSLIKSWEGLKVRILYDSPTIKNVIFLNHMLPEFSNVYVVVYSDSIHNKLTNVFRRAGSEIKRYLNRVNLIKIGNVGETEFGRIHAFIEHSTPREEFVTLMEVLKDLKEEDVAIFYGNYLTGMLDDKEALRLSLEFYGFLKATLFEFKHLKTQRVIDYYLNDLYDVVVTVTFQNSKPSLKCEGPFDILNKNLEFVDGKLRFSEGDL